MLHGLTMALMAASAFQWQTDTTVSVSATARLELRNDAGDITVTTWNRNAVRIQAEHGSMDRVEIEHRGDVVTVRGRRRHGRPIMDFRITVPATMGLKLNGISADITIDGVRGPITAETVEGDVSVRGAGEVVLSSVEGDITVDGARGRVRINGIDGEIRVSNAVGDLSVETIDGDILLTAIDAANVDASTVDGDIVYRGTVKDGGRYRFVSHDGDLTLHVGERINATISVATYDGDFQSDFPVQISDARPGRRFRFVLGSGSAQVELESFDGAINLRRR